MNHLSVHHTEDGIKLLDFILRHLPQPRPKSEIHRWIRTGQVRVNGGRRAAYDRLAGGDTVRLPPFVQTSPATEHAHTPVQPGEVLGHGLRVVAVTDEILVLGKPAGLASQPGSGQEFSVVSILADRFAGASYVPAPAHRLDKATSGLLLAGLSHAAQRDLSNRMSGRYGIEKDYLAWVSGQWPTHLNRLEDHLVKETGHDGRERMQVTTDGQGQRALSLAECLDRRRINGHAASLLRLRLLTGRTHQLRVQLASRGYPIVGDRRYCGRPYPVMLLHAWQLSLPGIGRFTSEPDWSVDYGLGTVPCCQPLADSSCHDKGDT